MKQLLLTEILDWVNRRDFKVFIEIDLDYLGKLYLCKDYLLAGEEIEVRKEVLSSYKLPAIEDNNFSLGKNK